MSARSLPSRMPAQRLVWAVGAVVVLTLLWWSIPSAQRLRIEVGEWGDHAFLRGIHAVENSSTENYRWTEPRATFSLPNLGERFRVLEFRAHGWRPTGTPPTLSLETPDRSLGTFDMQAANRVYYVLLPQTPLQPNVEVTFAAQSYTSPDDPRKLGVAMDWVGLDGTGQGGGPGLWQFVGQAGLIGLLLLLVSRLALPLLWAVGAGMVAALAPVLANLADPLWVSSSLWAWLLIAGGLLATTILLQPCFVRAITPWLSTAQARTAWALLMFAILVRIAGAVHPLFDMHDLPYHTRWMATAARGDLYIYSTPSEFQNQQTFNPPAGYVLLMPLALLLEPRLAVQVGVAALDAAACLLVLLLARQLGLRGRTGLLALALAAALPISMSMLWWGFATNALAQPVWLLLLLLLLAIAGDKLQWHGQARTYWVLGIIGVIALLMHVGALVLMATSLGLFLVFWWRGAQRTVWLALVGTLAAAATVAMILYFSAVLPVVIGQRAATQAATTTEGAEHIGLATQWTLFGRALLLGFTPFGIVLAPFGFALLRPNPAGRALVAAWLTTTILAIVAYFVTGLVVRDLYFVAPLVCLALGAVLDAIWQRGGRWLAVLLVAFVLWQGVALWSGGVLVRAKPSAVVLTR